MSGSCKTGGRDPPGNIKNIYFTSKHTNSFYLYQSSGAHTNQNYSLYQDPERHQMRE